MPRTALRLSSQSFYCLPDWFCNRLTLRLIDSKWHPNILKFWLTDSSWHLSFWFDFVAPWLTLIFWFSDQHSHWLSDWLWLNHTDFLNDTLPEPLNNRYSNRQSDWQTLCICAWTCVNVDKDTHSTTIHQNKKTTWKGRAIYSLGFITCGFHRMSKSQRRPSFSVFSHD